MKRKTQWHNDENTIVQWWKRNDTITKADWYNDEEHNGTMIKAQWYANENTMSWWWKCIATIMNTKLIIVENRMLRWC